MNTTIILQGKEAKMWAMMKALEALGVFDVVYGSVKIDFDGQGKISNVKVEKNFRVVELSTPSSHLT
jgi:hypothetical protein